MQNGKNQHFIQSADLDVQTAYLPVTILFFRRNTFTLVTDYIDQSKGLVSLDLRIHLKSMQHFPFPFFKKKKKKKSHQTVKALFLHSKHWSM